MMQHASVEARLMSIGVGGSSAAAELARMQLMRNGIVPINDAERLRRIDKAQRLMRERGVQALYLDVSSNLYYFTGIRLRPSERLHGAIIPSEGDIVYLSPAFEEPKTRERSASAPTCVAGRNTRIRPRS
jgi:Xaa-Pro dipeptidase